MFLALSLVTAFAQQAPVFRSSVDLVHLDVSVLDRDRRPVRGLTAANFTILEDGTARPVAAFAALEVKEQRRLPDNASWVIDVAPDVQTNDIARTPEGRLFVLLLDDGLIPADPAATKTARQVAETVIERMAEGDQMAVVFTVGSRGAQNFTNDRARLRRAVATFTPGHAKHVMGWEDAALDTRTDPPVWKLTMDHDAGFRTGSIRTLEMVAESLIAAPQRRKAIIYVSPGVFADPDSGAIVPIREGQSMMIRQANSALVGRLPELYRRMREGNVTIYPVDPMGLGGMEAYVQRSAAGLPAMGQARTFMPTDDWYNPTAPPAPMDLARKVSTVNLDFMKAAASNTGGLAITDTNDIAGGINRIFDENASYYLLGFTVPPAHRPGSLHRLQVRVNRQDVTVRARSLYAAPDPAPPAQESPAPAAESSSPSRPPSPATVLLAGPVPAGALPLRVAVAPFASPDPASREATVVVALGVEPASVGETGQTFDVDVRAFSPDGSSKRHERLTGKATLAPAIPGGPAVFDLLARIPLAPGRYELRFGAHLAPANLAGSVFADVEVPDFADAPVSMSGVLFESAPATNAGPLDALKDVVATIPTSRREFTSRDAVRTFLRVYQGAAAPAPASVRVTLVNRRNEIVFNNRFPLPVDRFDPVTRAADFTFPLPLRAIESGPYLLTFTANVAKESATRQVRFTYR